MGDEEEVGLYIIDQERELCSKHITLLATIVLSMNLHTNRGQLRALEFEKILALVHNQKPSGLAAFKGTF